jgi:PiT family inorganic phosphate transporter
VTAAILVLALGLAAANGANDVPKTVATLAGAGVTRYRTAIVWGALTTLIGSLVSLTFADQLTKLFSKGIVTAAPTPDFTLAVLVGTVAWVTFATVTRLPVSTTQALVGALVGAGVVLGADAVSWRALPEKVLLPTLLAVGVAYGVSFLLNLVRLRVPECVCVGIDAPAAAPAAVDPSGVAAFSPPPSALPRLHVDVGTVAACRLHGKHGKRVDVTVNWLHWVSSGAASAARGLNDTPKIVAVGAFALVPAGMSSRSVLLCVAGAMAIGSVVFGTRVARRLGEDVVHMDHVEGFKANLTTAALVGLAANRGLPLSTTQVSSGAIAGSAGAHPSRLNGRTLRDFALAWTVTPLVAALIAAAVFALLR